MNESTEAEFAMLYAAERKRVQELEVRLMGLLFETLPYVARTIQLIDGVATMNTDELKKSLHRLVQWRADIEANVFLNIYNSKCRALSDIPVREDGQPTLNDIRHVRDACKAAAEQTKEEWDVFAEDNGFESIEKCRQRQLKEFLAKIKFTVANAKQATASTE